MVPSNNFPFLRRQKKQLTVQNLTPLDTIRKRQARRLTDYKSPSIRKENLGPTRERLSLRSAAHKI